MPFLFLALSTLTAAHAVPLQLTQQGRILDSSGASITGTQTVTFNIYDDATTGTLLWTETLTVAFNNGYYAAILGSDEVSNPLDSDTLSQHPIYLELQLGSNSPMSPRHPINSAPYAQMSGVSESVDGGSVNATDVSISSTPVIDSGGNWVGQPITVDWNNLTSIPSYITDGDDNTQLTETEVETYVTNDGISLHEDTTLNGEAILTEGTTLEPEWLNIQSRPSGLDDGDDDTQLTASEVVSYVEAGSVNLANGSQVDSRKIVGQPTTCSNGQVLVYNSTSNDWACGDDTDTNLTATEMQTMIEALSLNLQNLPQVNGENVLLESSTIDPANIDASSGTDGQVLTISSGVPTWGDGSGSCSTEKVYGSDGELYAYLECGSVNYIHPILSGVSNTAGSSIVSMADVGSLAYNTYCGFESDNSIQCWGLNVSDQITDTPSDTFSKLVAGYTIHCGLTTAGEARCWGSDSGGVISDVPTGIYTDIFVGQRNACVQDSSGQITCWGQDSYNAVSGAPTSGSFQQVVLSEQAGCALSTSGDVQCWGNNTDGIVSNAPSGTYDRIFMGEEQTSACALTSSGSVTCWGNNNYNQVSNTPSGTFTDIEIGYYHICGIKSDQSLECWGDDSNGQSTPPSGTFSEVQCARQSSCGLHTNGELYCWGEISDDYSHSAGLTWTDFSIHQMNVCAMMSTGAISCWGDDVPESTCVTISSGDTLCWFGSSSNTWISPQ